LASALSLVSGVAAKNINLPILNNVLIKADDQKVEIISTNLELAIIVSIRANVFFIYCSGLLDRSRQVKCSVNSVTLWQAR
ncbi:MAG TPA: hypothetical protein PK573_02375, partial [Spirochaetota bacterium]|nr:hypothetical protein [Spirochaetota bacterium]